MSKVFVLSTNKQPLNPIHSGRARMLLSQGKAAVFRRYPFTVILKEEVLNPIVEPLRVKIDPGAKVTGLAIVNNNTGEVVCVAELQHRGFQIRDALTSRRQLRRSRRNRKTRYRKARFLNRTRSKRWLPPSLKSRVANILTWVKRFSALCQINAISQDLVRFDTQQMQDAEISGAGYQQGTLAGYEIREFLLEKLAVSISQQLMGWFKALAISIANTFTKRMGIPMHSNLDILGVLNPIKCPPFPPTTVPVGSVGVSTGEDR